MYKEYIVYRCKRCRRYIILINEEVKDAKSDGIYIMCPYHAKHPIIEVGEFDDIKDVLKTIDSQNTYSKKNRKIVQKGWNKNV